MLKHLCYLLLLVAACSPDDRKGASAILKDDSLVYRNMDRLTEVIIYDGFNPPVASRIYAYTSLAAYEALRLADTAKYPSLTAQLRGFNPPPVPQGAFDPMLAATRAFFAVAKKVTFSRDSIQGYEDAVYARFREALDPEVYAYSLTLGDSVGASVLARTARDRYQLTRGMAKNLGDALPGRWRPTPPDYMDGGEPHWMRIEPMVMDSSGQFRCPAPPRFSTDTTSAFFRDVLEVYNISKNMTDEQRTIARYWDDNPFVMEHAGHLAYANKKITPVGHWIGITAIASRKAGLPPVEAAQAYAVSSVAVFEAFIACWAEKYRTNVVRPVTVINETIDRNWQPMLQTPPFPEYPSGHSAISAAAATVLTERFGDNFAFLDNSDLKYIGMQRSFPSFYTAAEEASISRVYGGIHYRSGVTEGAAMGQIVGKWVNERLKLRN